MPTYSYLCDSCGHDFEAVQRFADDALTECPECGSRIRRVIQPVGVVFKGSGWYINDSRPKSSGESGESEAKSDSGAKPAKSTEKSEKSEKSESAKSSEKSDAVAKTEKTPAKVAD